MVEKSESEECVHKYTYIVMQGDIEMLFRNAR